MIPTLVICFCNAVQIISQLSVRLMLTHDCCDYDRLWSSRLSVWSSNFCVCQSTFVEVGQTLGMTIWFGKWFLADVACYGCYYEMSMSLSLSEALLIDSLKQKHFMEIKMRSVNSLGSFFKLSRLITLRKHYRRSHFE